MEKLTLNIPAWHKRSCWRWFRCFVLTGSPSVSPLSLDSTHIWDCEKHKNWSLSIIKTVLISSETFMTAWIKYHEPKVWWDVMPTFLFLPSHNVWSGSRCSTWDECSGSDWSLRGASVSGYHILHHFIDFRGMCRHLLNSHHYNLSIEARTLWVSSIVNDPEEMPFLQGSYWTFFDNWSHIQLRLWDPNSAVTTSQMPFNKEMGLEIF